MTLLRNLALVLVLPAFLGACAETIRPVKLEPIKIGDTVLTGAQWSDDSFNASTRTVALLSCKEEEKTKELKGCTPITTATNQGQGYGTVVASALQGAIPVPLAARLAPRPVIGSGGTGGEPIIFAPETRVVTKLSTK